MNINQSNINSQNLPFPSTETIQTVVYLHQYVVCFGFLLDVELGLLAESLDVMMVLLIFKGGCVDWGVEFTVVLFYSWVGGGRWETGC